MSPKSILGLLALGSMWAQEAPKFNARTNLVFLPTRVQTKKGETIYGLQKEQFIVEDNGVRQQVNVDEDPETSGLSLVVAVQCGRSAAIEFKKLKGLGAMIGGIVGDAPHEVAIVSYGIGPYLLSDFSRSTESVHAGLAKLKDCGSHYAATIDTVFYAINMLKRRRNHYRRAILLIGETRDHGSKSKLEDVVAELGITDTVIYSVAFSPGRDEALHDMMHANDAYYDDPSKKVTKPPPDVDKPAVPEYSKWQEKVPLFPWPPEFLLIANALRKNAASEIAALSGGEYANFTTQRGFDQELQRISNEIHNYYLISFKPSDLAWGLHTLKVRVADYPDAAIQTRRSYWAGMQESR